MAYAYPVGDIYVPADWHNHCCERNPPSSEPGTDYASAYGTPVKSPGVGTVVDVKTTNSSATGRYVTVDLDDGRRARGLHLSRCEVINGQRVNTSSVLGYSGASGYGSDYYYGSHLHQTLWQTQSYNFCSTCTLDFENYVGGSSPTPPPKLEDDEMILIESLPDRGRALIGPGYYRKIANSEELSAAAQIATKTLSGSARNFDVWKALADQGQGLRSGYTITSDSINAIASAVVKALPPGQGGTVDYDRITKIVKDALAALVLVSQD